MYLYIIKEEPNNFCIYIIKTASKQMDLNEKLLISKSKNGDTRAFEQLIKKHELKIYNLLLNMTGRRTVAEDLLQETFLAAWQKISHFKGNSEFSTWLYRIAVNLVLMKRRKKKVVHTVSIDTPIITSKGEIKREFIDDWSKNPLANLENTELKNRLNKAINTLPEKYKDVLVLRDVEGMTNDEVKKILRISLPSIKSRLHRARLFLVAELSKYFRGH
ncbi:MAG: sigma-70 family RNA polymerase sigma factor [Elusimicrobia bacterium]|nr:sigma-70 family RNA polymerase sigma factor [Elusimicrobiota bacterium]